MKKLLLTLLVAVSGIFTAYSQETMNIKKEVAAKSDADIMNFLRGLTIGGVVQAQWQLAQEKGMNGGPSSGGAFSPDSDNRFMLRRGYLKVGYGSKYFNTLIQMNVTPEGVGIVNAFVELNNASKSVAGRIGNIYKPFGYFISYPSGQRLTPEISRGEQTLFSDQTAPGVRFQFKDRSDRWTKYFSLDLAYFTGLGGAENSFAEKDFIGKIEYVRPLCKNFSGGLQFSYLSGSMHNKTVDEIIGNIAEGKSHKTYYNLGLNATYNSRIGTTKLFSEYTFGTQLGGLRTNMSPTKKQNFASFGPLQERDFINFYVYLQHQITKTNLTFIAKYDIMDPNKDLDSYEIGRTNKSSASDLRFSTFGFGFYYTFYKNLAASAYYEIVSNEKTSHIAGFEDNRKDNLLTLRLQCSF